MAEPVWRRVTRRGGLCYSLFCLFPYDWHAALKRLQGQKNTSWWQVAGDREVKGTSPIQHGQF